MVVGVLGKEEFECYEQGAEEEVYDDDVRELPFEFVELGSAVGIEVGQGVHEAADEEE